MAGCRPRQAWRLSSHLFTKQADGVIWTMYPKNVIENIPAHVLRQIREEIDNG